MILNSDFVLQNLLQGDPCSGEYFIFSSGNTSVAAVNNSQLAS